MLWDQDGEQLHFVDHPHEHLEHSDDDSHESSGFREGVDDRHPLPLCDFHLVVHWNHISEVSIFEEEVVDCCNKLVGNPTTGVDSFGVAAAKA